MKEQPVKSPIAYRDTHSFKYSTTSSHHAGEVVTLMQCSDENKHACYFRDGKDTFHLLPPRNLLQPFISQKKQWAWVKTSLLLVPHLMLAHFPLVPKKKERPAQIVMFSIHWISMVLKCPLFAFYLFTLKWELQVLVCHVTTAHNEKWQGSSISGVLSVHRLPAVKPSKVGTWVAIFP